MRACRVSERSDWLYEVALSLNTNQQTRLMETEQNFNCGTGGVYDDAFRFNLILEYQNTLCGRHTRGRCCTGGLIMAHFLLLFVCL